MKITIFSKKDKNDERKILKVTIVAAFALIAGNVYNAQKWMSDLALANVEALAQSEGSGSSGCRYRMVH